VSYLAIYFYSIVKKSSHKKIKISREKCKYSYIVFLKLPSLFSGNALLFLKNN